MKFIIPEGLAPEVYPLAWLVGRWHGEGVVGYPGMALVLILAAAVLITAGPFAIRALTPSNTQAPDKEPRLP